MMMVLERTEVVTPFLVECNNVYLCSQKFINRTEQINNALMNLITDGYQTIRDTNEILNAF